jgi:hypothetical protein
MTGLLAILGVLGLFLRRKGLSTAERVVLPSVLYLLTSILTVLWFPSFWYGMADAASRRYWIAANVQDGAAYVGVFCGSLYLGAFVVRRKLAAQLIGDSGTQWRGSGISVGAAHQRAVWLIGAGGALLVGLAYLGQGWSSLWERDTYLSSGAIPALKLAAGVALPLAMFAVSIAVVLTRRSISRWFFVGCWLAQLFYFLGNGSRSAGLQLAVTAALLLLTGRPTKGRLAGAMVLVVAGAYAMGMALNSRASDMHGLLPYLKSVQGQPLLPLSENLPAVMTGLLFGVPLAGATVAALSVRQGMHDLWGSVTPLPSALTNWDEIHDTLRLNAFVPFSGIGELGHHGILALVSYGVISGIVMALLAARLERAQLPYAVVVGLPMSVSLLFTVVLSEYNLRSATRYLWLAVAILLVVHAIRSRAAHTGKWGTSDGVDPEYADRSR